MLNSIWNFIKNNVILVLKLIFLVVASVILFTLFKRSSIGGLVELLFGKKEKPIDKRDTVPENRKNDKGEVIQPGTPDDKGYVQVPEKIIEDDDTDKNSVFVGDDSVTLPTGVVNGDVEQIIEIKPSVNEVSNNDTKTVDTKKLLNDLNKL